MQPSTRINRTHSINDKYFDDIDTQEKAYWLGFIWADGSISKTAARSSGPNRLRITQKWSERKHLERFRNEIGSDYSLKHIYQNRCYKENAELAQLDVNCRPLCAALEQLGYGPKNVRVHIPDINQSLLRHFMRGYFDGDGCLSIYTQQVRQYAVHKQEWSLTGNAVLMAKIKDILSEQAGTTPTVRLKTYKRSPMTASLRYGKKADIATLYEYLYENATVYLDPKHEKFVEFFSRLAS